MKKLEASVVYSSSEDPAFPSKDLCRTGPVAARGWQSARGCEYPQQIGLVFAAPVFLERLQFLVHDSKVPTTVEVHVAEFIADGLAADSAADSRSYHEAVFRRLGYVALRCPAAAPALHGGELRCIAVGCEARFVKLLFSAPHPHPLNLHAQVGITSVVCLGQTFGGAGPSAVPATRSLAGLSAAARDVVCDAQVLQRIAEFERSKDKAIVDDDLESARRIHEQLRELPLVGLWLAEQEHAKSRALLDDDYDAALLCKVRIARARVFVAGLKPGMPLQRFRFDNGDADAEALAAAGSKTSRSGGASPVGTPPLASARELRRARSRVMQQFDDVPARSTRAGGGGAGDAGPAPHHDEAEEPPLDTRALAAADAALLRRLSLAPAALPESVGEQRATRIKGWQKMSAVFGEALAACLFSRKYAAREAAVALLVKEGAALFPDSSPADVALATALYVSCGGFGVGEPIASVFFHCCDLVRGLVAGRLGPPPRGALRDAREALVETLFVRAGDTNPRIRQSAMQALHALAGAKEIGVDGVARIALAEKPKNFRSQLAILDFVFETIRGGTEIGEWRGVGALDFGAVQHALIAPTLAHANPTVRERALDLLCEYVAHFGAAHPMSESALAGLKPQQLAVVEKRLGSNLAKPKKGKISGGAPSPTPKRAGGAARGGHNTSGSDREASDGDGAPSPPKPRRRTVAETKAKHPELAAIYDFPTPGGRAAKQVPPAPKRSATTDAAPSVPPRVGASPLRSSQVVAFTASTSSSAASPARSSAAQQQASPTSLVKKRLADARESSSTSLMPRKPPRRPPPRPVPGMCQFCELEDAAFSQTPETLLEHFRTDCPMLCLCPLCDAPIEIREINWHLADDCPRRQGVVRQCPRCFQALRVDEFDEHVRAAACPRFTDAVLTCPLCNATMLCEDAFWAAHILDAPFCPQNPRTSEEALSAMDAQAAASVARQQSPPPSAPAAVAKAAPQPTPRPAATPPPPPLRPPVATPVPSVMSGAGRYVQSDAGTNDEDWLIAEPAGPPGNALHIVVSSPPPTPGAAATTPSVAGGAKPSASPSSAARDTDQVLGLYEVD